MAVFPAESSTVNHVQLSFQVSTRCLPAQASSSHQHDSPIYLATSSTSSRRHDLLTYLTNLESPTLSILTALQPSLASCTAAILQLYLTERPTRPPFPAFDRPQIVLGGNKTSNHPPPRPFPYSYAWLYSQQQITCILSTIHLPISISSSRAVRTGCIPYSLVASVAIQWKRGDVGAFVEPLDRNDFSQSLPQTPRHRGAPARLSRWFGPPNHLTKQTQVDGLIGMQQFGGQKTADSTSYPPLRRAARKHKRRCRPFESARLWLRITR